MDHTPVLLARQLKQAGVNDLIEFGAYPLAAGDLAKEPIRWRVLDCSDSRVLLISDRILDCRRYHREFAETTWRDCDLRAWLNDAFFSAAFGEDERELVQSTPCTDNGDNTPDTVDNVFLLSAQEVRTLTDRTPGGRPRRAAISTEFARVPKMDGCRLYVYDKAVERDYLVENGKKRGCSWWWTRTQLQAQDGGSSRAAFIGARGDVKSYGRVDLARYGVRPAISLRSPST